MQIFLDLFGIPVNNFGYLMFCSLFFCLFYKSETWLQASAAKSTLHQSFTQCVSCRACKAGGKQGNVVNFPKD